MKQYHDYLNHIKQNGTKKSDRTGTGTTSVFGYQTRFDLSKGFPLVTTKKTHLKSIIHELLWFLKGDTNIRYLKENGVRIWDEWLLEGTVEYLPLTKEEMLADLAKHYGRDKLETVVIDSVKEGVSVSELCLNTGTELLPVSVLLPTPLDPKDIDYHTLLNLRVIYNEVLGKEAKKLVAGSIGKGYGFQWRSWPVIRLVPNDEIPKGFTMWDEVYNVATQQTYAIVEESIDQISQVIETLKTNPDSRRMIVSAWNAGELDKMALPPCHAMFQFYTEERDWEDVLDDIIASNIEIGDLDLISHFDNETKHLRSDSKQEGWKVSKGIGNGYRHPDYYDVCFEFAKNHGIPTRKLSCQLYQRSSDAFLGWSFNVASYSLLVMMIAQVVNMVPGEFVWTGGDCHIYDNHMEQVDELLSRKPYSLPTMRLNPEVKNIFDFKYEDFELSGYECHPTIKATVAV